MIAALFAALLHRIDAVMVDALDVWFDDEERPGA